MELLSSRVHPCLLLCWFRVPLDSQAKLEHLAHPAPKRRR